jgi:hypothetical protein
MIRFARRRLALRFDHARFMVCVAIRRTFVLLCSLRSFVVAGWLPVQSSTGGLPVQSRDPLYVRVPWVIAAVVATVFEGARGALVSLVGNCKRVTSDEIPYGKSTLRW